MYLPESLFRNLPPGLPQRHATDDHDPVSAERDRLFVVASTVGLGAALEAQPAHVRLLGGPSEDLPHDGVEEAGVHGAAEHGGLRASEGRATAGTVSQSASQSGRQSGSQQ